MGVDMFLESSQIQASETQTLAQSLETAYVEVQSAIQSFTADTDSLKGKAYDSARSYYSELLLPLAQGGELLAIAVGEAVAKLPSQYEADVDSRSWTQDELERKIAQEQEAINMLDDLNQSIRSSAIDSDIKSDLLHGNAEMVRGHHANKRAYEQILSDLLTFDTTSATFFEEALDLLATIRTGLSAISDSWDSSTGTFKEISDRSWATTLSAKYELKDLELSEEDAEFAENLVTQYGFDSETVALILKVRDGIDEEFPVMSQEEKDYLLLRIIGSVSYGAVDSASDEVLWDATAGDLKKYFYNIKNLGDPNSVYTEEMSFEEIMEKLGLTEDESKELYKNLTLQHGLSGATQDLENYTEEMLEDYAQTIVDNYKNNKGIDITVQEVLSGIQTMYGKTDFTHQSITMATVLRPSTYGPFNGQVEDLAGWEGDTTRNANERTPSIGNEDYKADLDAVNITSRMEEGQTYIEAFNSYHEDLSSGKVTREGEFNSNVSLDEVKTTIFTSLVPNSVSGEIIAIDYYTGQPIYRPATEEESMAYLKENYESSYNFIRSLEDEKNYFEESE